MEQLLKFLKKKNLKHTTLPNGNKRIESKSAKKLDQLEDRLNREGFIYSREEGYIDVRCY